MAYECVKVLERLASGLVPAGHESVAQRIERVTPKHQAAGSNPARLSKQNIGRAASNRVAQRVIGTDHGE